jgi:hypothetical protein
MSWIDRVLVGLIVIVFVGSIIMAHVTYFRQ